MPTYEFRCPKGHEFTRFYKTISGSEMRLPCPECGVVAERIMSVGGGLHFKGSGFYLTDYGKNAHRGQKEDGGRGKEEGGRGKEEGGEKKSDAPAKADAVAPAASSDPSVKPKAESREPKAESPKPKSEKPKARSDSRKPRAK